MEFIFEVISARRPLIIILLCSCLISRPATIKKLTFTLGSWTSASLPLLLSSSLKDDLFSGLRGLLRPARQKGSTLSANKYARWLSGRKIRDIRPLSLINTPFVECENCSSVSSLFPLPSRNIICVFFFRVFEDQRSVRGKDFAVFKNQLREFDSPTQSIWRVANNIKGLSSFANLDKAL